MKVFSTDQIQKLDKVTIDKEPISSIELMERASQRFTEAFTADFSTSHRVLIFAGPGNNGGDALAIARLLSELNYQIEVFLFNPKDTISLDCETNKSRLLTIPDIKFTQIVDSFSPPAITANDVVIDGLFGSGLNAPLSGGFASVVKYLNSSNAQCISIDIPSGLFGEDNTNNIKEHIVRADKTYCFQSPKLAFFLAENAQFVGEWKVLDIQLHPDALDKTPTPYYFTEKADVRKMIKSRARFSHKGDYGHALIVAGSRGKTGAAILAAEACMRCGVGLLTCHLPECGVPAMQSRLPEAMINSDPRMEYISEIPNLGRYKAIGVGPGIGLHKNTASALESLLQQSKKPLVLDADALNLIGENEYRINQIPGHSILTPHPKEFDRISGESSSSYERLEKAKEFAGKTNCFIVLKGAYSVVITPEKECHFNSTGNPGMATAGSGDVLTGMILGLLTQGYSSKESAILGVFLHGLAGDIAASSGSQESLIAGDIIRNIKMAWKELKH